MTAQTPISQEVFDANGELFAGVKETIKEEGLLKRFPVKTMVGLTYEYREEAENGEAAFREIFKEVVENGDTETFKKEQLRAVARTAVVDHMEMLSGAVVDILTQRVSNAVKSVRNTLAKGVLSGTGTNGQIKGLAQRVLDTQKVPFVEGTDNLIDAVEAVLGKVVGDNVVLIMNSTTARKLSRLGKKEGTVERWNTAPGTIGGIVTVYGNAEIIGVEDSYLANNTIYAVHLSEEDGVCILQPPAGKELYLQDSTPTTFLGQKVTIEYIATLACFNPKAIAAVVPEPAEPVIP